MDTQSEVTLAARFVDATIAGKSFPVKSLPKEASQSELAALGDEIFAESQRVPEKDLPKLLKGLTQFPHVTQVSFWLKALDTERDWARVISAYPEFGPTMVQVLRRAAQAERLSPRWWANWDACVNALLKRELQQWRRRRNWIAELDQFLALTPALEWDLSAVKTGARELLGQRQEQVTQSTPTATKQVSDPLLAVQQTVVKAVEQAFAQVAIQREQWHRERAVLEERVAQLDQRIHVLEAEKGWLEEQLGKLRREFAELQAVAEAMTIEKAGLERQVEDWKRMADILQARVERLPEELALDFRNRLRKGIGRLAGYTKDQIENVLGAYPGDERIQLMALNFDELHRLILAEADLPQSQRLPAELIRPGREREVRGDE